MHRPSGIYRRADTTSPPETGLDSRVSMCGWLYYSGNGILPDKIPTGGPLPWIAYAANACPLSGPPRGLH